MTLYAVGDIHGQAAELDRVLRLIEDDGGREARVVFLGDYTDRGPDSRGVLDRLVRGRAEGRDWVCVMGNHDRMFLRFVAEGEENDVNIRSRLSWLNPRVGGAATLASYGLPARTMPGFRHTLTGWERLASYVTPGREMAAQELVMAARDLVPEPHLAFLAGLPLWHREGGLLFVHAGIRPGIAMESQSEDDLIWIRDGFLEDGRDHGALIVHGHTALERPEHCGNRVNLDGGAGYGRPLWAAAFDRGACFLLTEGGRERLCPAG
ncbi:MAG: metallophosphoesterase family protein [Tranquillimonas sp.]